MLDVFRGMTGRRKYVPKELAGETLCIAQPTKEGEDNSSERRRQHLQLPQLPAEGAGSGPPNGGTAPDFPKHAYSPGSTATAVNSPVAQSGTGDYPTSSLLERPEASPATERWVREGDRHGVVFRLSKSCVSFGPCLIKLSLRRFAGETPLE